jgi:hypothetical protein
VLKGRPARDRRSRPRSRVDLPEIGDADLATDGEAGRRVGAADLAHGPEAPSKTQSGAITP